MNEFILMNELHASHRRAPQLRWPKTTKTARKTARGTPKALAKPKPKVIGPAPALTERDFYRWVNFLKERHSVMVAVIVQMTGAFALRCGEACQLSREDFLLEASPPQLKIVGREGAAKSPGAVPLHPRWVEEIRALEEREVQVVRKRRNQHGEFKVKDTYKIPSEGFLFPSPRASMGGKPITYHSVWEAVNKLAPKFAEAFPGNSFEKLRTHSGRVTAITAMLGQGVSVPIGMKFARHKPGSVSTFLAYGQLTASHVYRQLLELPGPPVSMLAASSSGVSANPTAAADPVNPQPPVPPECGAQAQPANARALEGCSLKDLMAWRQAGLLDEFEFQALKKKLLGQLASNCGI